MATWRRCSSCKAEIPFDATYWVCSVSTCTRPRVGFFFCSVACWEAHLPSMRHREAWAVEEHAPSQREWERQQAEAGDRDDDRPAVPAARTATAATRATATAAPAATAAAEAPRRRVVAAEPLPEDDDLPQDILIVVSKLKKYVRARSGMNTSDNVVDVLSDFLRKLCDQAIRKAGEDGRKTVLDRDFRHFF